MIGANGKWGGGGGGELKQLEPMIGVGWEQVAEEGLKPAPGAGWEQVVEDFWSL